MIKSLYVPFVLLWFLSCNELTEPCIITNANVTLGECQTDSTYILSINFTHRNAGNYYFDIYDRNSNSLGYFDLSELPITIENFKISNKDYDFIEICINDNTECCIEVEFEAPDYS